MPHGSEFCPFSYPPLLVVYWCTVSSYSMIGFTVVLLFLPETAKLSLEELDMGRQKVFIPIWGVCVYSSTDRLPSIVDHTNVTQFSPYLPANKLNGAPNNPAFGSNDIFFERMSILNLFMKSVSSALSSPFIYPRRENKMCWTNFLIINCFFELDKNRSFNATNLCWKIWRSLRKRIKLCDEAPFFDAFQKSFVHCLTRELIGLRHFHCFIITLGEFTLGRIYLASQNVGGCHQVQKVMLKLAKDLDWSPRNTN